MAVIKKKADAVITRGTTDAQSVRAILIVVGHGAARKSVWWVPDICPDAGVRITPDPSCWNGKGGLERR